MTIQQLKAFLTVCDTLNFTAAAEQMFISRQALRQNITALEQELDAPLFLNIANHLSLTEAGKLLQEESLPVAAAFDNMQMRVFEELNFGKNFTICISTALVPDFLPNLTQKLDAFAEREHLHFHYQLLPNSAVTQQVLTGAADCGLVMDLRSCHPSLYRRELSAHPASLLISNQHPCSNQARITVSQLYDAPLCLPGEGIEFAPFFEAFRKTHQQADFYYFPSFYQVYYNVRENGYIALNRYSPKEIKPWDGVRNIPFADLPPLSSAILFPVPPSRKFLSLWESLSSYYRDLL